ncbi:MAG: hypothetical protein GKS06_10100 [Acidobacteria bacterium]|nr:hypothetical protein [Acidobacteriota bacterium]
MTLPPLSARFVDYLEIHAPVEYIVLHHDLLPSDSLEAARAAATNDPRLRLLRDLDGASIFRVVPHPENRRLVQRTYSWPQARGGVQLELRRTRNQAAEVEVGWGLSPARRIALPRRWTAFDIPPPADADRAAAGSAQLWIRTAAPDVHTAPLGTTEVPLSAEILVDAQWRRMAIAIDDAWVSEHTARVGLLVAIFGRDGRNVTAARRFGTTLADIAAFEGMVREAAEGAVVAIAATGLTRVDSGISRRLAEVAELIGVDTTVPLALDRHTILGVRGAVPGTAMQRASDERAALRAGPPARRLPEFQVRVPR